MKNVVVGCAVIGEDMLEFTSGKVNKSIGFVVGDRLVDLPESQEHAGQGDGPQYPVHISRILPGKKQVLKCTGNGPKKLPFFGRLLVHGAKSAPAQTRTALFGSGGRHSVH